MLYFNSTNGYNFYFFLCFFFVVVLPGGVVAAFGVVYKPDPGKFSHLIRGVPPRIQF